MSHICHMLFYTVFGTELVITVDAFASLHTLVDEF